MLFGALTDNIDHLRWLKEIDKASLIDTLITRIYVKVGIDLKIYEISL